MKHVKNNSPLGTTSLINWFFDDVLTKDAFNTGNKSHSVISALNRPSTNVIENESDYTLELAAPGLNKEDFSLSLDNRKLTISTEESSSDTKETKNYKSREFNFSAFKRSFMLPENGDLENISAEYTSGVLYVVIPKKEKDLKDFKIQVK